MKLPMPTLDVAAMMEEFDVWITASLGEIRDTGRFRSELESVANVFEAIGAATGNFADMKDCDPVTLARTFVNLIAQDETEVAKNKLLAFASVLFLVSGKSDNNAKCQLPIYLRDRGWTVLPVTQNRKGHVSRAEIPISRTRTLDSERYMGIVAGLNQILTRPDVFTSMDV